MEEYVEHSITTGLAEIGFSDHMPLMPEPKFCMGFDDLKRYADSVRDLQKRYDGRIIIRLGCEMDMVFERLDEAGRIIEDFDFDYVIGSIHYLDGWPFDQVEYSDVFEKGNIERIYENFFDTIIRAAETGLYDITGHIDNIKRMGYRPDGDVTETFERVAGVLKAMDCTVEVNMSGIDTAAGEPYPSPGFLKILCRHDVPVTVGSDAHSPDQTGRYFDRAVDYLHDRVLDLRREAAPTDREGGGRGAPGTPRAREVGHRCDGRA